MPTMRSIVLMSTALWLAACSAPPTPRSLAQDAVTAMGGAEKLQSVQTITMSGGAGTRLRLGQTVNVSARAVFQPDLYTPGTGAGGPAAEHLLKSIQALNLKVDTMVGGHGGIGPFADLVKAAAPKPASN